MLRIGREADNDICLSDKTVHRYHAVIHRTTDGAVVVTDLSGADGNGVLINGTRVGEGRLTEGDIDRHRRSEVEVRRKTRLAMDAAPSTSGCGRYGEPCRRSC